VKPSFHHTALNGPFGDPAVYVRILRERAGLLFDMGDLSRLPVKEIMKLTDVFVTHMHIDHFVGFDHILRVLLRRKNPVSIYGPEGITDCVEGKLKGYSWNLITEYPLKINVCEVIADEIIESSFSARNSFRRKTEERRPFKGTLLERNMFSVRSVILDHGIQALGFKLEEKFHINIDKSMLLQYGMEVGPWLNRLKQAIWEGAYDRLINTGASYIVVRDLSDLYKITEGQKIAYIMDSSPSGENYRSIVDFVRGCDTLYIEAYFADSDMDLAIQKSHLTSGMAGRIAGEAGIKDLKILHFSPRYMDEPERLVDEAMGTFRH